MPARRDALIHGMGEPPRWPAHVLPVTVARPSVAARAGVGVASVSASATASVIAGVVSASALPRSPIVRVGVGGFGVSFGTAFGG